MSQVTGASSSGGEPTSVPELLGLQPNYRRAAMFRDIKDRVLAMNNSSHVHPVLLVDEAHLLSPDILAGIRLLVNFEIDSLNALTVILCGSEMLTRKFGLSMLSRTSRTTSSRAALGPNPAAVVIGCNALAMSVSLASESVP